MIYVEKGVICMRYAAVMFDVIESRKYSERYEVQQMLMELYRLSKWYISAIA